MTSETSAQPRTVYKTATAAVTTACIIFGLVGLGAFCILAFEAISGPVEVPRSLGLASFKSDLSSVKQYAGPQSGDISRLYPPEDADGAEQFTLYSGLKAPKTLVAPDVENLPPFASVAPHMGNETQRAELGRSAWHLIHTMGNTYPLKPTHEEKFAIISWVRLLGMLYPCGECAEHFRDMLKVHPPESNVESRDDLSLYLCRLHNRVNLRLEHKIFDCSLVSKRWKCGCTRDSLSDGDKNSTGSHPSTHSDNESVELPDGTRRPITNIDRNLEVERRSLFPDDYSRIYDVTLEAENV